MITRSSVRNLQAKAGLPTINQAAGWTTLSMYTSYTFPYPLY
jgi:hypothetical protein